MAGRFNNHHGKGIEPPNIEARHLLIAHPFCLDFGFCWKVTRRVQPENGIEIKRHASSKKNSSQSSKVQNHHVQEFLD